MWYSMRTACRAVAARLWLATTDDAGTSTVEYAVATVAAAAFAAVLYSVVTGGNVVDALTRIIDKALNTSS
jgi:hypothetical protein